MGNKIFRNQKYIGQCQFSHLRYHSTLHHVVPCTCNPATLEAESWNGVGSIPVGGNSLLIGSGLCDHL